MNKLTIGEMLSWCLDEAERDAPLPPKASWLLKQERAWRWWEEVPSLFEKGARALIQVDVLGHIEGKPQVMEPPGVRLCILHEEPPKVISAPILAIQVQNGKLVLRLKVETSWNPSGSHHQFVFVSPEEKFLFAVDAELVDSYEFRIEAQLPEDLAASWENLKLGREMPFMLIIRPGESS